MLKRKEAIARTDKTLRLMRCFEECTESLSNNKPFPQPVCYQRSKIYYKLEQSSLSSASPAAVASSSSAASNQESNVYFFDAPIDDLDTFSNILNNFEYLNSDHVYDKHNIDYLVSNSSIRVNNLGKWILVTKLKVYSTNNSNLIIIIINLIKLNKLLLS
jgi:hypothetical protein